MPISSTTSRTQRLPTEFRAAPRPHDADAVEALVRATGVFNDDEVVVARELVEENAGFRCRGQRLPSSVRRRA